MVKMKVHILNFQIQYTQMTSHKPIYIADSIPLILCIHLFSAANHHDSSSIFSWNVLCKITVQVQQQVLSVEIFHKAGSMKHWAKKEGLLVFFHIPKNQGTPGCVLPTHPAINSQQAEA